jgi:Protein of unknown function (DUF1822)
MPVLAVVSSTFHTQKSQRTNISQHFDMLTNRSLASPTQPNPGEIWEIDFSANDPIEQDSIDDDRCLTRYVAIVRESQSSDPQVCSVMLLSIEIQSLSSVDLLIPSAISGLDRDLLAETWNVGSLSIDLLVRRVGNRLSRQVYDLLLSVGDVYHGLSIEIPSVSLIQTLGLDIAPDRAVCDGFHQREQIWLQNLNSIVMTRSAKLVNLAATIERESRCSVKIRTALSHWFQQIVEPPWREAQQLDWSMAIATRGEVSDDEITETISKLKFSDDEEYRCQLIQRLGSILFPFCGGRRYANGTLREQRRYCWGKRSATANGTHRADALAAIVEIVQTTQDDETLWTAVASLHKIDPFYQDRSIRKLQSINLGVMIDFVVNIIPKANDRFGILLQVYPEGSALFLPANLKLILQDECGNSLREVVAQAEDCCIQLKLSGVQREIFSVCLELDGVQSIVDFVI